MSATSTAGDVTGTTANAGGTAAITGVGVSLGSLTAGGTALIQAVGPTSASDPVAGEVTVAQFVRGNGANTTTTPAVTIKAYDAITLPIMTASVWLDQPHGRRQYRHPDVDGAGQHHFDRGRHDHAHYRHQRSEYEPDLRPRHPLHHPDLGRRHERHFDRR